LEQQSGVTKDAFRAMIIPNIGGGAWGQLLNISINTMKLVGWLTNRRLALVNRGPKDYARTWK